jgi:PAS domain S-box-containing protein
MADFWQRLFDTSDFPARWNCGDWTPGHGWLHIASDLGVWSAYLAIPCVLVYFAAKRPDLPFRRVFWLFGAFILACGTTHLMEAIIFWWPAYRLAAVIKLFTALVSWATVLALVPITPRALALRSPQDFEREIDARQRAEAALRAMQAELEQRVAQRTLELSRANVELQAEMSVRQHVEKVLEGEREWFEVTIDSIGDAVIATDTKGQVMFLNRVARELTEFDEQVDDQPLATIFRVLRDNGQGEPALDPVSQVLRSGATSGATHGMQLLTRGGQRRPIEHSAAPIRTKDGQMLGVVLVFRDISERRRAEEALLRADRHKDEFLAMLGHELRNPLAGIAGAVHVLDAIRATNAEAVEMRSIIDRQTTHMSRLIDDLLEVSRISRGKTQLRLERLDLVKLVRATVDDFRLAASDGSRKVTLEVPPDSVWVMGDPTRLAQVLINLLQNADKFSPAEGQIKVEMRRDGNQATIRVKDDGIGMDEATLAGAFEPFRQADQSLDRSRGGLGLGLALVKGLIELHGGHVAAHSGGVGQGAEFTIRLPLTEPATAAMPRDQPPPDGRSRRVLIIDDRRDAALPMQTLLRRLGHEVAVAADGPQGVRMALATLPEIVLCDIGLPGDMDGYAVAAALRSDPTMRGAYLVAVTGYGQEEDRRKALAAGFDRHLTKPVGLATLREVLAVSAAEPSPG